MWNMDTFSRQNSVFPPCYVLLLFAFIAYGRYTLPIFTGRAVFSVHGPRIRPVNTGTVYYQASVNTGRVGHPSVFCK